MIEDLKNQCHLVAKGNKNGKMFTFDVELLKVEVAMFAHGRGVIAYIEIWHKRIGHVNIQMLKSTQTQSIIARLQKFRVDGMQKVCEACQMGKQARYAFPRNAEVSKRANPL